MEKRPPKTGLWMIGACGRVGSTVALGLAALARRKTTNVGLVTALHPFQSVRLADPATLVLGGHEIRGETLVDEVRSAQRGAGIFGERLVRECAPRLRAMQRNIRPGTLWGSTEALRGLANRRNLKEESTGAAIVERLADDIRAFRARHRLDVVVVVHVASTEPPASRVVGGLSYDKLARTLVRSSGPSIPTSCLYALAALEAECPYINFTPSTGVNLPAIRRRADRLQLPYMGSDGKTGETLVKSALAPMFAMRHLKVLSWVGQNILGNLDGRVLADPQTRSSKIKSKDGVVSAIVGGAPTTRVAIEYVPSLDDWKVAWDYIHFEGFLGTRMAMQFIWQGCDSVLAAPLIIDLVRLTVLEFQRGGSGPMKHLAFFFKDPIGVTHHDLESQWRELVGHVTGNRPFDVSTPRRAERVGHRRQNSSG